ncbi:MAG: folate family ECF transporter S component [Oscillospiraceae bacterium]|nr:folate family ECF transporter S component [Oscillospiraceae bacterium]MDY5096211.1 folate family ECF transporter S component [Oscillospiraceae bacterium]
MQSSSALFGTFSPLTPAYWADARAQLKNVRMLTLAGIITAASIVLESFPIYLLGTSLKIYFSFLVISLGCYVYGPAVGILVGFANDTLGFLISSFGEPYFPGYLITAMLSGLIYGTLLYRQRITVLRLVMVRLVINYGSNVLLGSVWKAMLYGKGYYYYFTTGLVKNTTMLPIEVLLMVLMFQLALPALARSGLLPKEVAVQKRLAWF